MIIVAGGDSFVWGNELSDCTRIKYSKLTFPALLAQSKNLDYTCAAWPSNANNAISRMTMRECCRLLNLGEKIFVFVVWTFDSRFEFRFNYNTNQQISPWYSINPWTIEDNPENILAQFITANSFIGNSQIRNIKTAIDTGVADFAKTFYKHVGDSEYYELYSTLKEIVFIQNFLKINNIPYMFTTADWQQENYERASDIYLTDLYNLVDWDSWYFFPAGDKIDETRTPRGFYQWAIENKYKIGTTHPLEKAHSDAALLMKEKFNEMVKKYL
jgi:hypothetical protein